MTCMGNGWARIAALSVEPQPHEDRMHEASGTAEEANRDTHESGEDESPARAPQEERSEPCA